MIIIWNRWGILILPIVALGVGIAFLLELILGVQQTSGAHAGIFVGLGLVFGGALVWVAVHYLVGKVIDKPKLATGLVQLAEPVTHPNGQVQTHQVVPLVDPATGQQAVRYPVSTLFFIPAKYWPFILGIIGGLVFLINLAVVLAGGR